MRAYRVTDVVGLTDSWVGSQREAITRRAEVLEEGVATGLVPKVVSVEEAHVQCRFEIEEIPDSPDELLEWLNQRLC